NFDEELVHIVAESRHARIGHVPYLDGCEGGGADADEHAEDHRCSEKMSGAHRFIPRFCKDSARHNHKHMVGLPLSGDAPQSSVLTWPPSFPFTRERPSTPGCEAPDI